MKAKFFNQFKKEKTNHLSVYKKNPCKSMQWQMQKQKKQPKTNNKREKC